MTEFLFFLGSIIENDYYPIYITIPTALVGFIIFTKNKKKGAATTQTEEKTTSDKTDKNTADSDKLKEYDTKYKEYLDLLKQEANSTTKYQLLYSRIMGTLYKKNDNVLHQNRLSRILKKATKALSKKRLRFSFMQFRKIKRKQRTSRFFSWNFNKSDFYKYFFDRIVRPVPKNRKRLDRSNKEVTLNSLKIRKSKLPSLFTLPIVNKDTGPDKQMNYRYIRLYRTLYLPYLERIYLQLYRERTSSFSLEYLASLTKLATKNKFTSYKKLSTFNKAYNKSLLFDNFKLFPFNSIQSIQNILSQSKDDKALKLWKKKKKSTIWLHTLLELYTTNRVRLFKFKKPRQRVKMIETMRQIGKGRKRRKIRSVPKFDRYTRYIFLNYFYSIYLNWNGKHLHKALKMNYSKYPFYKSSLRYMPHDFFSLLKRYVRRVKKHHAMNKRIQFVKPPIYFIDQLHYKGHKYRSLGIKKGVWDEGKRVLQKQRLKFFGTQSKFKKKFKFKISLLFSKFLQSSDKAQLLKSLQQLEQNYLFHGRWAKARLDLSMATYALLNPVVFQEIFNRDLIKLKSNSNSYRRLLIQDPFGIQKIGSTFFFYLGKYHPIFVRFFNREQLDTMKKTNKKISDSKKRTSLLKKISLVKKAGKYRPRARKWQNRKFMRNYYKYGAFQYYDRYNQFNLINSLIRSYILLQVKHLNNNKLVKTPFSILYKSSSKSARHLSALYGYLFKTEQYRRFKKSLSLKKRNRFRFLQTPKLRPHISIGKYQIGVRSGKHQSSYLYDASKRYLKLKLQGNLPEGIYNLKDWYQYINHIRKRFNYTSSRYFYLPFHLKSFLVRNKFFAKPVNVIQGIKGKRYSFSVRRSRIMSRLISRKFKFLQPKYRSKSRVSRYATQLNQTRYSLLHNHYFLIKELVNRLVYNRKGNYYLSLVSTIRPLYTRLCGFPNRFLIANQLQLPQVNKIDKLGSFFNSNSFFEFCTHMVQLLISYVFPSSLLDHLIKKCFSCIVHLAQYVTYSIICLGLANIYFIYTFPGVQRILGSLITYLGSFLSLFLNNITYYIYVKIKTSASVQLALRTLHVLCIEGPIKDVRNIYRILTRLISFSSDYIAMPTISLVKNFLLRHLKSKDYIKRRCRYMYYKKIMPNIYTYYLPRIKLLFVRKIIRQTTTFIYNYMFTRFIIKSYFSKMRKFKPAIGTVTEYRMYALLYTLVGKVRAKGFRYLSWFNVFAPPCNRYQAMAFIKTFLFRVQQFFFGYYARPFHWYIRPAKMYQRLLDICYGLIWDAFFGRWFLDGYIHVFRRRILRRLDEDFLVAFYDLFTTPYQIIRIIYRLKPWTYDFIYRTLLLDLFVASGYLLGLPIVAISRIIQFLGIHQFVISLFLCLYKIFITCFVYSHALIQIIYYTTDPFLRILLNDVYVYMFTQAQRYIGGFNFYAINFHEELLTFYTLIVYTVVTFIQFYLLFVRLPEFILTLYRMLRIKMQMTSYPFIFGDSNIDLRMNSFFGDWIDIKYLKSIYEQLRNKNKSYFSNDRILWFLKKAPIYSRVDYRFIFASLNNKQLILHIRKHSNILYKTSNIPNPIKLKTKWLAEQFPYDFSINWLDTSERHKTIKGFDMDKFFYLLRRQQNLFPLTNPHIRRNRSSVLRTSIPVASTSLYSTVPDKWTQLRISAPKGLQSQIKWIVDYKLDRRLRDILNETKRIEYKRIRHKLTKEFFDYLKFPLLFPVDKNLVNFLNKYLLINKLTGYLSTIIIFLFDVIIGVHLTCWYYFYKIAKFMGGTLIASFMRRNSITFASFEHWVFTNLFTAKPRYEQQKDRIQLKLHRLLTKLVMFIYTSPWRLLKLVFKICRISYLILSDIYDIVIHIKQTAVPFIFKKNVRRFILKSFFLNAVHIDLKSDSNVDKLTQRILIYLKYLILIVMEIMDFRLFHIGEHPFRKKEKGVNTEFKEDNITDLSKRPSNIAPFLPYRANNILQSQSNKEYITLDQIKDQ